MTIDKKINKAMDLLLEHDYVSWYQEAVNIVFNYINYLETKLEAYDKAESEEKMTKEEAKKFIAQSVKNDVDMALVADAIKALEQEPCEDAISRKELLKAIDTWDKFGCDADTKLVRYQDHYIPYIHYDDVIKCIKSLPPVTPQPKIGHWIDGEKTRWKCSGCGYGVLDWNTTPYCPNCGAKMEVTTDETNN